MITTITSAGMLELDLDTKRPDYRCRSPALMMISASLGANYSILGMLRRSGLMLSRLKRRFDEGRLAAIRY